MRNPNLRVALGMASWLLAISAIAWGAKASGLSPDWDHAWQGAVMMGSILSWVPLVVIMAITPEGER